MTDEEKEASHVPVSPSTGLDGEIRQFMGRIMLGYESAHRTIADMAAESNKSTAQLHKAVTDAIAMQLKAAEEREELLSKRHKRDLEATAALAAQESKQMITRDVRSVLLLAGKKYLGVPLTGNDSHGLQDLLSTLSGDQIDAVMTSGTVQLTDAQRQMLMATLSSLADEKPKAAE